MTLNVVQKADTALNGLQPNTALTNYASLWMQDQTQFVASQAFPSLSTEEQGGVFYGFSKDDLLRSLAQVRADATETQRATFGTVEDMFFSKVWGIHTLLSDRASANTPAGLRLREAKTNFVMTQIMRAREIVFADTFLADDVWGTTVAGDYEATPGAGQFVSWAYATSDPVKQVMAAADVIHKNTGYRPNKAIMSRQAWTTLRTNDAVASQLGAPQNSDRPNMVTRNTVRDLFELDALYVMDGVKRVGTTNSFIGGDKFLLYYAPESITDSIEPTAGINFNWTGYEGASENGVRITTWFRPELRANVIEAEAAFHMKLATKSLGYLFTDVSTETNVT